MSGYQLILTCPTLHSHRSSHRSSHPSQRDTHDKSITNSFKEFPINKPTICLKSRCNLLQAVPTSILTRNNGYPGIRLVDSLRSICHIRNNISCKIVRHTHGPIRHKSTNSSQLTTALGPQPNASNLVSCTPICWNIFDEALLRIQDPWPLPLPILFLQAQ